MKLRQIVSMLLLVVATTPALAAFTLLPTDSVGSVRVFGSNNLGLDPFILAPGTSLPGGLFELPSNLVQLALRETEFELVEDGVPEEVGTFQDAVFRDTNDNSLVFGSRIVMDPQEDGEINDIYRRGWAPGYSALAAWVPVDGNTDLRLFSAGRTTGSHLADDDPDLFDIDTVALGTDVNVEELKPTTAWYLVKTNAPTWALGVDGVGVFQAGEEGQLPQLVNFDGYIPTPIPAGLPLFLSALGFLGYRARARQ
ncbi:MAG: hypothetical protein AAF384_15775 [Pseudomonadota bacterium]